MTNQNNYTPAPVDTTNVQLPEELMALAEAISKNCLVPYEELSEEEKAYDRNTALSTLKFIVALGFEINKT